MQVLKTIKEGKVREIYDNGDNLIMVATDRISCFDVILNNEVTKKGTVLTQMSKFWFDYTSDILPNHMISVDTKDMPEYFQQEKFEGKSMLCRKLNMLPIECIVRGYITGSGWASYKKQETFVVLNFQKDYKNHNNFQNQFIHLVQRLKLVITMKTFLLNKVLRTQKNTSQDMVKNMQLRSKIAQLLYIKNALSML